MNRRSNGWYMRDARGLAAVEFALVLPVLIVLLFGIFEVSRFLLITHKLDKATASMGDFTAQISAGVRSQMDVFASTLPQLMKPFEASGIPTVTFSGITSGQGAPAPCTGAAVPCVAWKYTVGNAPITRIGAPGGVALFPPGFVAYANQNYIAAELAYVYRPIFAYTGVLIPSLRMQSLYRIAIFKPRLNFDMRLY